MTMEVPAFVSKLIDDELLRIKRDLLRNVSAKYEIPYEELEANILNVHQIKSQIGEVSAPIKIVKTRKSSVPSNERCLARTWARGEGGQCNRRAGKEGLCLQHAKQLETDKKLKHGWIHEKPPKDTFTIKRPTALYK